MAEQLDMDRQIVTKEGKPTSYLEEIVYQLCYLESNPPASASAEGIKGTVTFDDDYLYVAIDTDTWKRVALSSW